MTTIPYTYLLVWPDTGMKYYGVRYAKNCAPDDLWVQYFTSSKLVHEYAKVHGKPVRQIRKTFTCSESARLWEHKVLKKLQCASREDYLNQTDSISFPLYTQESHPNRGRDRKDISTRMSGSKWYNNGQVNRRILNGTDIPEGFVLGRLDYDKSRVRALGKARKGSVLTESHKKRIRDTLQRNAMPRSQEVKVKISEGMKLYRESLRRLQQDSE